MPTTHINGNVVLTPEQTCNAAIVDNAGGVGLCAGVPPAINGTVLTNVYPDTTTAAAIKADLNAAFLSTTSLSGPPAVGSLAGGTSMASSQRNTLAAFDITMKTGATACGQSMAGARVGGAGAFIFDSNGGFRAGQWVPALVSVGRSA